MIVTIHNRKYNDEIAFEIDRNFYERAKNEMLVFEKDEQMDISDFIGDTV